MVDGSAAIHPHNLDLLMLRGISSTGPHGHAKQCVINAFETDYMLSVDDVMANILHLAHNMDEDDAPAATTPHTSPPPISAFVAAGRGSHNGRGHPPRVPRGGRVLPSKCTACGSPTTSCPLALPRMTLSCGGHSRSANLSFKSTAPLVALTLRTPLC
jgi:hypothetical protein